jgi:Ca2+-binding RTX toxin-like protein
MSGRFGTELGRVQARWFGEDRVREIDEVWTGWGDDRLVGTSGRDTFYTSMGRDVVRARAAVDTLSFDSDEAEHWYGPSARVDLASGRARFGGGAAVTGHLRFTGIERVTGSDKPDTILGDGGDNRLVGGQDQYDGDDVIHGRGGDDVLLGTGGDDVLDGGTGENRIDGGSGVDTCTNPSSGPRTTRCEAPQ